MFFSVITVTYNSGSYLKQTIDSIFAQRFTDFELIIGDDCSLDDSWEIILKYADPRIRRYRNDTTLGEYANRTKALQQATGKYLIFIDGDDLMYEHALSTLARYIEFFPECAMYFSREWDPRILCPFKVDPLTIYRFEYLDGGIMGGNFTKVLFKTEILKDYSFPEGIRSGDSYIQLKIAQQHPALVVPGGLTWWRRRKDNASHQLFSDNRHFAESIRYRSALLGEGCPLSEPEIKQAKINMYGVYMRQLIRLLFAGEFADLVYLVRHVKIPVKYWLRIFSRSKHNFYADVTGDRPLHTHIPFK